MKCLGINLKEVLVPHTENYKILFKEMKEELNKWKDSSHSWNRTLEMEGCGFHLWVSKIPWRTTQQPTPVFLPGKSHGQRSPVDYSARGHKQVGYNLETKQQPLKLIYKFNVTPIKSSVSFLQKLSR